MDPGNVEELERTLKALANANRLHLLITLQEPRRIVEIDLVPQRGDPWGSTERSMSRQAVLKHVQELMEIGVVESVADASGAPRYVVNHARLYEATEQLRELATVKPTVPVQAETLGLESTGKGARITGPHLVLVRGVREGQAFPLTPPGPTGGWTVGRRADADVPLDYDAYVSGVQARILLKGERHFVAEDVERRNPTYLNWQPMIRGGIAPLEAGDLLGVGMSLLLYRA